MSKKRIFPNDWSKLLGGIVAKNIRYLCRNYKKHDIAVHNNYIQIDNIKIQPCTRPKSGTPYKTIYSAEDLEVYIDINNREIQADNPMYLELGKLCQDIKKYNQSAEKRFRDWIKKNYKWVFIVATGAKLVSGMGMYLYATNKKQSDIKTQTVTQEYEAQKAKTVNLTDSINQNTK
ncbi:MAG: hypothetical protein II219_03890 [Alphaproteobacteria bacterium]|nr:hypothetical protein [Alphaproteobacteria bacterium]